MLYYNPCGPVLGIVLEHQVILPLLQAPSHVFINEVIVSNVYSSKLVNLRLQTLPAVTMAKTSTLDYITVLLFQ
jgi:hypothetical protein